MRSVTTHKFRKALDKLPLRTQLKARQTYNLWKDNRHHPSLEYKQIHANDKIYSVRVGIGYRAI